MSDLADEEREALRNTLAGSWTELRAACLAIVDPLMQLLTHWLDAAMALIERVRKG